MVRVERWSLSMDKARWDMMALANKRRQEPHSMSWRPISDEVGGPPLIVYGYAVHPFVPTRKDARWSSRNRDRLSVVTEASTDDHFVHRDVVSLEVGDEIYAFEKYTPAGREVDGPWYRGYVVCTTRRPPVKWAVSGDAEVSKAPTRLEEPQQVFIGIFPASHIYIRDELIDPEGRLSSLAGSINGTAAANHFHSSSSHGSSSSVDLLQWQRDRSAGMDTLKEEEEDRSTLASTSRRSFRLGPPPDQASFSRVGPHVYSTSLRSSSPAESHMKPLPPRPSLKSGDDTASGAVQPIIDEISSALREWHTLMFQYLARRDYHLFHLVREHIEALHLGRRQLLAQTLSAEETINLRRECVTKLVSGNLAQGLDVIVRHPSWGGLVNIDVEGEIDPRSWVSGVRMYAMQASLAYLKPSNDGVAPPYPTNGAEPGANAPLPSSHPVFSDFPLVAPQTIGRGIGAPATPNTKTTTKFFHIFLELRAFVASFCSPGETAELFFSLFRKQDPPQFVTEDFCVILNHHGVLARNPAGRIRTLFTDLALADVQDPVYLVCRIVRNGSLKLGIHANSASSLDGRPTSDGTGTPTSWTDPTQSMKSPAESSYSQFRRPFGCAVLELTQLAKMISEHADATPLREHTMPIYVPTSEISFSMIHQNIITNQTRDFEKSSRAEHLAVSVKVFKGDSSTIVKENTSLLQDTPHTLRLGFPDVVFPGESRNELYVKLWSGDFGSSHGSNGRLSVGTFARGSMGPPSQNIQVTVEVRDNAGQIVDAAISQGSGEPMMSQFNSLVFQRCNEPTFGELIKIQLPPDGIPQWHLFFTFKNRSSRERPSNRNSDNGDRPFGFAFLPLFPDTRAFVEDGPHTLVIYKADKVSQIPPELYLSAPAWLPSSQRPEQITFHPDILRLAPPLKDTLIIRSSLCSTKFTQNAVLLSLLNWDKIPDRETLTTILNKFTFVGEGEIVKFLRNIFDSLFGILVSQNNQSGEMDHLVFDALVTVLGIVQDRRFSNFQPVLDVYIQKHFNCAPASSHLLHSMNRLVSNPASPDTAPSLRAALKVWHYVVKFIARSRELQKAKEIGIGGGAIAEHLDATFKRELRSYLSEVTRMMTTSTPPSIIGTQTIALQHFTSILPELANVFSTVDLVSVVTTFATNAVTMGKGKIVIWKLIMYLQIVKGFLFDNAQSRPLLVEAAVLWIKPHFGKYDEYAHTNSNDNDAAKDAARVGWLESTRLCVTIIAVMLDKLQQNLMDPSITSDQRAYRQEQDNLECLLPLLPRLLDSYRELSSASSLKAMERVQSSSGKLTVPVIFPESYPFSLLASLPELETGSSHSGRNDAFVPAVGETAIVFLTLILSSPTKHIVNFLDSSLAIEGRERFVSFLMQFFRVANSILENDAFPKNWLNANILAHRVLTKMMDPLATLLQKEFIPPKEHQESFDARLWKEAFSMLLKLLSSEHLVIEEFSAQKRRAVWRLAGDLRGEGAIIMLNLWQQLGWEEHATINGVPATKYGGYQVYLASLVGQVVHLCLSHHEQLRSNAVQMLYSMIVSQYQRTGHFEAIETELISRLDSLFMADSKNDDISGSFFVVQLRHLFESSDVDERLRERVAGFLDAVDMFLELLLSVRALPDGEEFADERVIATLRLMNFIRRIGRDEIYIKYVHQLVNMHLQSQNYVEAALTLKLHSDLYQWDLNAFIGPMEELGLPQQSQFHRKETLCLLILDYLGKGKAWESAVEICKEIALQHAEITFNYGRLSEILRHQATLLEHIVTEQRYYPDYYLVTFYGNFPTAIRDKRFVYRGYEWEKFDTFCERMLSKHTGAQLVKTAGDVPVEIRDTNEQYIQCIAVSPEPNRQLPVFMNADVPLSVRTYYEHSAIGLFSSSRLIRKIAPDGSEEVWTEKTYFTTEEIFPTVLRRSQVVGFEVVEISPLETALSEVESKTRELTALNIRFQAMVKTSHAASTNALAMCLNSAVDSPAGTGISAYRQTLFSQDYIARYPDRAELVDKLRLAVDEQVRAIDQGLKLHGQLCPGEFVPFHETLEKFFKKNFKDEIRRLGIVTVSDEMTVSPSVRSGVAGRSQSSTYEQSLSRSMSTVSATRKLPFTLHPLKFGRPPLTPPPQSPQSPTTSELSPLPTKQTPLQRHLAHLARHGISGVSSAPGETTGSDSLSAESRRNSVVNAPNPLNGVGGMPAAQSGVSVATSHVGSLSSLSSLKGRFSRFGSLNFGRRAPSTS